MAQASDPIASSSADTSGFGNLPPLNRGDRNLNPPGIGFSPFSVRTSRRSMIMFSSRASGQSPSIGSVTGGWTFGRNRSGLPSAWSTGSTWAVELIRGVHLPYTVRLGRRVRIWHHGGIVLHARAIGDDVHIRHNTTFGIASRDQFLAIPTIGDRVDIGCGACVLGTSQSVTTASSVPTQSSSGHPSLSTAVGVPARVIKQSSTG